MFGPTTRPWLGKAMPRGSRTVAQQGDIAMRRFAIDLLTLGHVGDGMEQPAVRIFCLDH